MKIADPGFGRDPKAAMLVAILATREPTFAKRNDNQEYETRIETKLYDQRSMHGDSHWVELCLYGSSKPEGFRKRIAFGQDPAKDQFAVDNWAISEEAFETVYFPNNRVYEAVEFIVRQLAEAYELMQEPEVHRPTRLEAISDD